MTRKDRTEGIYSRREVLDESERRQYNLIAAQGFVVVCLPLFRGREKAL